MYYLFIYLMSTVLLFPFEVELLKREYFNRWYGLKPYFVAMTLKNLPMMIISCTIFILPTYLLTDQPLTLDRFIRFALTGVLTAATSEGLGLVIGSICSVTVGAVLSSIISGPLILFCIYGVGQTAYINFGVQVIMYTSFLRCSFVATLLSIFADRRPLDCTDEVFCYYGDPERLLKEAGMLNASYGFHMLGLIVYLAFFRIIAFVLLRYRLTSEFSGTFIRYISYKN
ncbi:hypothetical protein ILUMI_06220 [Ignelater luminosus]|uniref:ABC-2 type transporter transmembrane domain-containing protein n=1 Tax=Ignelater luminosus TaxID=2038154 RepID=A0A8K0D9N5_IGNLU|nr:hypothetical protein ILUMI_06220 [Ignelater luminosus]